MAKKGTTVGQRTRPTMAKVRQINGKQKDVLVAHMRKQLTKAKIRAVAHG